MPPSIDGEICLLEVMIRHLRSISTRESILVKATSATRNTERDTAGMSRQCQQQHIYSVRGASMNVNAIVPLTTAVVLHQSDRFIPARSAMDFDYCHNMMASLSLGDERDSTVKKRISNSYTELLDANFLLQSASHSQPRPLLSIRKSTIRERERLNWDSLHPIRLPIPVAPPIPRTRKTTSNLPTYILDAPELRDDYYLNIMDWGANGVIAIALGKSVYLYTTATAKIRKIRACTSPFDYVASVAWVKGSSPSGGGNQWLAIGTFLAELQFWDVETLTKVRSIRSQGKRIGALSCSSNSPLASGSRDSTIHLHDMRSARHLVTELAHRAEVEVCGLAWSPDGRTLASGTNDSSLCLWDHAMVRPHGSPRSMYTDHRAAVRALAWYPRERHILASGGGTADGTIKIWSTASDKLLRSMSAESQVCALVWSTTTREIVTAHGYGSERNHLTVWSYSSMTRVRELTSHNARVLHLALSPDGSSVASAGADETLQFWNLFPPSKSPRTPRRSNSTGGCFDMNTAVIR